MRSPANRPSRPPLFFSASATERDAHSRRPPSLSLQGAYDHMNAKDALSYLDQVRLQFPDHPDAYNEFLDMMKDLKSET